MGFIMDGLDAESYDRQYRDRDLVKRIFTYFRPQAGRIAIVALVLVLSSVVNTGLPIYISSVLDQLELEPETGNLITTTVIITGIGVLAWVFNFIRQRFQAEAVGNVVLKIREDAFDAVVNRDLSFYDTIPSGKIVSRVTSDTQAFSQVVTLTADLLSQFLLVVLLVGYLFTVSAQLTLVLLAIAPVVIFTALMFRKIARDTVTQTRRILAVVSSHIQETISGIRVAKTFRQEGAVYQEFLDVNNQAYRINLRTGYTFSSIFPILNIIAGIGTAALVYFGGRSALEGEVSAGSWYLFIQGMAMFWFPLTSIASFWSQFQLGLAAGERVFALLDAESKVVQTDNVKLPTIKGEIRFENVNFQYNENETVLEN